MYKLKVITSTVRPGRKGPAIAKWITEVANNHGFEAEMIDLGELNLPLMNTLPLNNMNMSIPNNGALK